MSGRMRTGWAAVILAAALGTSGCIDGNHLAATVGSKSEPYQEYVQDPVTLTTIKTIAVMPFDDQSGADGFDADLFADKIANHLAATGRFRVLYPAQTIGQVKAENDYTRVYNAYLRGKERFPDPVALALPADEEDEFGSVRNARVPAAPVAPEVARRFADPHKNVDEAVRLARRAKADAVLVGVVTKVDSYMRPSISFTVRLIATGQSAGAAEVIAEMTQWGVPHARAGARGELYIRQQTYDAREGNVGYDVSHYGRTHHNDNHPYGTEAYLRSLSLFYDVVGDHLARVLADAQKAAVKEAERRATEAAKNAGQNPERARADLIARLARDADVPDVETHSLTPEYWDRRFPHPREALAAGQDTRIQSWRPEGRDQRRADPIERDRRDRQIPENNRGAAMYGGPTESESGFPDPDALMASSLRDGRDYSWRPDHYNRNNPEKGAALYAADQRRGQDAY